MPKSHHPLQGGPRSAAWSAPTITSALPPSGRPETPPGQKVRQQELEAEIQRLRTELARAQSRQGRTAFAPDSRAMVWIALILCGGCLVFAIMALLRHG